LDRAVFLPDLARDPGAVWALRERFLKIFRVARIAVSACFPSTSLPPPHTHKTKKQETASGPSGGDFSPDKTGLPKGVLQENQV